RIAAPACGVDDRAALLGGNGMAAAVDPEIRAIAIETRLTSVDQRLEEARQGLSLAREPVDHPLRANVVKEFEWPTPPGEPPPHCAIDIDDVVGDLRDEIGGVEQRPAER